jgi:hypothetical protein
VPYEKGQNKIPLLSAVSRRNIINVAVKHILFLVVNMAF